MKGTNAAGQYPLIIEGGRIKYTPWQNQDLEGLVKELPSMHTGAAKWIREFEDKTQGKKLALGDLKAILARTLGTGDSKTSLRSRRRQ